MHYQTFLLLYHGSIDSFSELQTMWKCDSAINKTLPIEDHNLRFSRDHQALSQDTTHSFYTHVSSKLHFKISLIVLLLYGSSHVMNPSLPQSYVYVYFIELVFQKSTGFLLLIAHYQVVQALCVISHVITSSQVYPYALFYYLPLFRTMPQFQ